MNRRKSLKLLAREAKLGTTGTRRLATRSEASDRPNVLHDQATRFIGLCYCFSKRRVGSELCRHSRLDPAQ